MIRTAAIAMILSFSFLPCFAQGFNWQYNNRLPFEIPDFYYSLGGGYNMNMHTGNLPILEKDLPCCNFTGGTGKRISFHAGGEYWHQSQLAFSAKIGYSDFTGIFKAQKTEPRKIDPDMPAVDWVTELEADINISLLGIDLSGKYLFENSHFYINAGLLFDFILSDKGRYFHKVISPDYLPFENGVFERTPEGKIPEPAVVVIQPKIGIGYDLDMGLGAYFSPNLILGYNLNSWTSHYSWHTFSIGLSLSMYRSFR